MPDEHHEVFGEPVRHLDGVPDSAERLVVAAQILDLARQIVFDGAAHARVQEFNRAGAVEVSVQVSGVIQDLDVAVGCRALFNDWHQRAGMRLQCGPVAIDPVEHDETGNTMPDGVNLTSARTCDGAGTFRS